RLEQVAVAAAGEVEGVSPPAGIGPFPLGERRAGRASYFRAPAKCFLLSRHYRLKGRLIQGGRERSPWRTVERAQFMEIWTERAPLGRLDPRPGRLPASFLRGGGDGAGADDGRLCLLHFRRLLGDGELRGQREPGYGRLGEPHL